LLSTTYDPSSQAASAPQGLFKKQLAEGSTAKQQNPKDLCFRGCIMSSSQVALRCEF